MLLPAFGAVAVKIIAELAYSHDEEEYCELMRV